MNVSLRFLVNIVWILLLLPGLSCKSTAVVENTDIQDNNPVLKPYAVFGYDYGVKGVAPVEMINAELTGGSLTVEADPADPSNQCLKL